MILLRDRDIMIFVKGFLSGSDLHYALRCIYFGYTQSRSLLKEISKNLKDDQKKIGGKSQSERVAAQLSSTIVVAWYDGDHLTGALSFQGVC
jgi:hypothetical protein